MQLPVLEQPKTSSDGRFDRDALERALKEAIEGEVRFDAASRAAYSTDASNYRRIPTALVVPRTEDDVVAAVRVCHEHGVPIVSRGGGTSLNGQCCTHGVVLDCSKYLNAILDIDIENRTARVQPGLVLDTLNKKTKAEHGLAFAADPSTHTHCTFGGMLGNNSCGPHSIMGGRASDNVIEMDIVTGDGTRMTVGPADAAEFRRRAQAGGREGEIYSALAGLRDRYAGLVHEKYPDIPRRVSGYNLPDLLGDDANVARALVGSEGTCVAILNARIRLIPWPEHRVLLVLGYPSIDIAADDVPEVMAAKPVGLEGMDDKLVEFMRLKHLHPQDVQMLPEGKGWLLVEFGADTPEEAERQARDLKERLDRRDEPPRTSLMTDPGQQERIWVVRESGLGATAFVPTRKDAWPGWEDAAIPPARVGDYLRDFRALLDEFGYDCSLYGHFGQGCIHCRIDFEFATTDGVDKYREFVHRAAALVVDHGGSLSAEHGDGIAKSELLPIMYGQELVDVFREFKAIWDPDGVMNPGKIVDAPPVDTDLRLGKDHHPDRLETQFVYPEGGDRMFERAAIRCVGVGKCRRRDDAFMCPSYIATQEEVHTTRGRARLLFEMTKGEFITDDWRSDAVRESLDLCLGCKGCVRDCPVNVDMATYKAEFLHHHYKRRLRPRSYYAMGFIGALAPLGSAFPRLANAAAHAPVLGTLSKKIAGIATDRDIPRFADQTFTSWFKKRTPKGATHRFPKPAEPEPAVSRPTKSSRNLGPVLLLPDAFNNHFFPGHLRAATRVLERLGYTVEIPPWRFPALRPLIHYGFLGVARRGLRRLIDRLDDYAREGVPMVGLEPSTVAVLRDENQNMFPADPPGKRVHESAYLLSEFLAERHLDDLPTLGGRCVYHAHCHQKAVLEPDAARQVLRRLGLEIREPEPGCCGMAGSFGFEAEHADLSRRIGENHLLPAVREADPEDLIIIEGFSCYEQIAQDTGRTPKHLAEVVAMALTKAEAIASG